MNTLELAQELEKENEHLKKEILALKNEIERLKKKLKLTEQVVNNKT